MIENLINECGVFNNITSIENLNKHGLCKVFKVTCDDGIYKVRVNTDFNDSADCESRVLTYLNMVQPGYYPNLYYKSDRLLIEDYIGGVPLDQLSEIDPQSIAKIINRLHSIETPCTDFTTNYDNWYLQFATKLDTKLNKSTEILGYDDIQNIEYLLDLLKPDLLNTKSVLLHGDIKPSNILQTTTGEYSFIDFESCIAGDADYDISMLAFSRTYGGAYERSADLALSILLGTYKEQYLASYKHLLYTVYFALHWAVYAYEHKLPALQESISYMYYVLNCLNFSICNSTRVTV